MQASELYKKLEKDFITEKMTDDWFSFMDPISDFICQNFKERSMGLVCDFTKEINRVYTAVFSSDKVMAEILDRGVRNAMLFVHHPSTWDIRRAPEVFQLMSREKLEKFRENEISIYNLHTPLDNFGKYSTSFTLAEELGVSIEKTFAYYFGAQAGVLGHTKEKSVYGLKEEMERVLGHKVGFYNYGSQEIKDQKVAVVAGGGNEADILKEVVGLGVNIFVTGITAKNNHSQEAHDFAKDNKINILGGTHYSTEKFACQAMVGYFENLGLPTEFIPEFPILEDL